MRHQAQAGGPSVAAKHHRQSIVQEKFIASGMENRQKMEHGRRGRFQNRKCAKMWQKQIIQGQQLDWNNTDANTDLFGVLAGSWVWVDDV